MTEPTRPRVRRQLTTLELRLYVVALLAVVYVIAWRAIAPALDSEPEATTTQPLATPTPAAPRTRVVSTAPRAQPRPPAVQRAPARIVRVPARRRVRTRSS